MENDTEILWRVYQEHCAWERHQESQRSSATNLVLVISGGVLSVVTVNGIKLSDLPLTAFLVVLGLFGALLSLKHYEQFGRHQALAKTYRKALNGRLPAARILDIRHNAEKAHGKLYQRTVVRRIVHAWRLHWLWASLQLAVAATGAILTVLLLIGWST